MPSFLTVQSVLCTSSNQRPPLKFVGYVPLATFELNATIEIEELPPGRPDVKAPTVSIKGAGDCAPPFFSSPSLPPAGFSAVLIIPLRVAAAESLPLAA